MNVRLRRGLMVDAALGMLTLTSACAYCDYDRPYYRGHHRYDRDDNPPGPRGGPRRFT